MATPGPLWVNRYTGNQLPQSSDVRFAPEGDFISGKDRAGPFVGQTSMPRPSEKYLSFAAALTRLLRDNGSSYLSADVAEWLEAQNMEHVQGAPYHPRTQGKIEPWHQTLKNRILENYYLPGDLEDSIRRFVDHYNHRRYHESLRNLTPADVYFGRAQTMLLERERIKRSTIQNRRLLHQKKAA